MRQSGRRIKEVKSSVINNSRTVYEREEEWETVSGEEEYEEELDMFICVYFNNESSRESAAERVGMRMKPRVGWSNSERCETNPVE